MTVFSYSCFIEDSQVHKLLHCSIRFLPVFIIRMLKDNQFFFHNISTLLHIFYLFLTSHGFQK